MQKRFRLILLLLPPVGGCFSPEKPSLASNDPALKIPAMKEVAREHDENAKTLHQLVKDLDSDDPAVRFYAINTLKELTGNTFDYRYYDDEIERVPALKRWNEWLAQREGKRAPTTQP
jgi:hypothetical protein